MHTSCATIHIVGKGNSDYRIEKCWHPSMAFFLATTAGSEDSESRIWAIWSMTLDEDDVEPQCAILVCKLHRWIILSSNHNIKLIRTKIRQKTIKTTEFKENEFFYNILYCHIYFTYLYYWSIIFIIYQVIMISTHLQEK